MRAGIGALVASAAWLAGCGGLTTNDDRGVVYGTVTLIEGDCMPVTSPLTCRVSRVARRVVATTPQKMVCKDGRCDYPNPVATSERGSTWSEPETGEYELTLRPGKYSLFIEEPPGSGDLYARTWSSKDGWIEQLELRAGERVERPLDINYATH